MSKNTLFSGAKRRLNFSSENRSKAVDASFFPGIFPAAARSGT